MVSFSPPGQTDQSASSNSTNAQTSAIYDSIEENQYVGLQSASDIQHNNRTGNEPDAHQHTECNDSRNRLEAGVKELDGCAGMSRETQAQGGLGQNKVYNDGRMGCESSSDDVEMHVYETMAVRDKNDDSPSFR